MLHMQHKLMSNLLILVLVSCSVICRYPVLGGYAVAPVYPQPYPQPSYNPPPAPYVAPPPPYVQPKPYQVAPPPYVAPPPLYPKPPAYGTPPVPYQPPPSYNNPPPPYQPSPPPPQYPPQTPYGPPPFGSTPQGVPPAPQMPNNGGQMSEQNPESPSSFLKARSAGPTEVKGRGKFRKLDLSLESMDDEPVDFMTENSTAEGNRDTMEDSLWSRRSKDTGSVSKIRKRSRGADYSPGRRRFNAGLLNIGAVSRVRRQQLKKKRRVTNLSKQRSWIFQKI
ncbi:hypothetical protein Q1695_003677 [Nippostrongylus brasiliensis]|nr:hypothetical protein Q1695_003677 [Nippostrongylus brasiliensis]